MDLRSIIQEVLSTSTSPDPADLVRETLAKIPIDDSRDALHQCLLTMIRNQISLDRMRHRDPDTQSRSAGPAQSAKGRHPGPRIAEHWRRILDVRYACGPSSGEWKFLGDFTPPELDYAAAKREELGNATLAEADRLRTLAKAVLDEGVDTVRALPPDILRATLGD